MIMTQEKLDKIKEGIKSIGLDEYEELHNENKILIKCVDYNGDTHIITIETYTLV